MTWRFVETVFYFDGDHPSSVVASASRLFWSEVAASCNSPSEFLTGPIYSLSFESVLLLQLMNHRLDPAVESSGRDPSDPVVDSSSCNPVDPVDGHSWVQSNSDTPVSVWFDSSSCWSDRSSLLGSVSDSEVDERLIPSRCRNAGKICPTSISNNEYTYSQDCSYLTGVLSGFYSNVFIIKP